MKAPIGKIKTEVPTRWEDPIILCKFPSRERPEKFLKVIKMYMDKSEKPELCRYLVSLDRDDPKLDGYVEAKKQLPGVTFILGSSKNKVDAINRDVDKAEDWDVLFSGADDMECNVNGWDKVIREKMAEHFPDTSGCLWFYDGTQKTFATMAIMGRKAYNSVGYIYHPTYQSLHCDREWTEFWMDRHRLIKSEQILFLHTHPASYNPKSKWDGLYKRNEVRTLWNEDEANYNNRKKQGFPI